MNFKISARLWRPQTFDEVVGQKHLIQTLSQAVLQGKIAQAYLFSGMRGVGKTSVARILAKALNCSALEGRPCNQCVSCQEITEDRSMDVMQIDGASNTSVDDVRELREIVQYLPLRGARKIVIIDEVHMLSNAAFNALLKTLEEPPPHLVFILATTEAHKIPATILSRCQHFIFRAISTHDLDEQLKKVLSQKEIKISGSVLAFIIRASEGSLRDALSLLDQAIAFGGRNITEEALSVLFGRVSKAVFHKLIRGIQKKDTLSILHIARDIEEGGYDLKHFLLDWIEYLRQMLVVRYVPSGSSLLDLSDGERKEIEEDGSLFSEEEIHRLFSLFAKLLEEIRNAPRPHLLFEVTLMKSILLAKLEPIEKIIEQISAMAVASPKGTAPLPQAQRSPIASLKEGGASSTTVPTRVSQPAGLPTATETVPSFPIPGTGVSHVTPIPSPLPLESWTSLLKEVKRERPSLASYLGQGKVLNVQAQKINIGFSEETSFLIPLIQKEENKIWLRALSKRYFEQEMQITCVPMTQSIVCKENETADAAHHPLVQEALKVFTGAVLTT